MKETQINKTQRLEYAHRTLAGYKAAKRDLEARLEYEREAWKTVYDSSEPSSWIFNSIVNKHADVIDSIPTCTCLPREKRDEISADALSKIIPVITQRCRFEQSYSDNAWNKLRYGTAVYGVFWNTEASGGLGDVDIRPVDVSALYWEMGISDIQDSKNVFLVSLADRSRLQSIYGESVINEQRVSDDALKSLDVKGVDLDNVLDTDCTAKLGKIDGVSLLALERLTGCGMLLMSCHTGCAVVEDHDGTR